jgi:hypothetical protein
VPFAFVLRKEVFAPNEKLENPLVIDLIFQQIVSDILTRKARHPQITDKEHNTMKSLLDSRGIAVGDRNIAPKDKVSAAAAVDPTHLVCPSSLSARARFVSSLPRSGVAC